MRILSRGSEVQISEGPSINASVAVDGEHARLVPVQDPVALAGALKEVLYTADLREHLVANGIARADRYSMRSLADRYISLYQQVLSRSERKLDWAEVSDGSRRGVR